MSTPESPSALPPPARGLAGLLLAAGASRRFGSPKAAHDWQGDALAVRAARQLLAVCGAGVVVVTGAHREAVEGVLRGLPVVLVHHAGWEDGMGSSIAAGARAVAAGVPADGLLLLPCDLPALTATDLAALAAAWRGVPEAVAAARFATAAEAPRLGPPVIFPRRLWPLLMQLRGESGARDLVARQGTVQAVDLPGAALDVDTPADLARYTGPMVQPDLQQVRIEYFAVLREHVGRDGEELRTAARTVGDLYRELDARYHFPAVGRLKVALNDEFRDWETPLSNGDVVVFIPPVAGG